MTYVLIIILGSLGADKHIAMQEFNTLETCQLALEQVKEMEYFADGICVMK